MRPHHRSGDSHHPDRLRRSRIGVRIHCPVNGGLLCERGKETVFAGLEEAQSSLTNKGGLVAIRGSVSSTNAIVKLRFVVTTAISGKEIDLTPPNTANDTGDEPDATPAPRRS